MGKKSVYTKITPLPSNVPRQLALDMLHSHVEVIELNPLVTGVKSVDAPRDAVPDEYFSQWYEISEIITWGFGIKKKIAFKGVFHDQPWGLQTHVYAPMGVDMRNRYSIGGNQPGEPREARELGLDIPHDGLYLREDVEITCGVPMTMGFVKKEAKAATGIMIQRLTRKAELLDEGKLHAMFEQGLLKTSKPNMVPTFADKPSPSLSDVSTSPISNLGARNPSVFSATDAPGFKRYHDIAGRHDGRSNRDSIVSSVYQQPGDNGSSYAKLGAEMSGMPEVYEMPGSTMPVQQPGLYPLPLRMAGGNQHFATNQSFVAELPGDNTMLAPPGQNSINDSPQPQYSAYQPSHSAQASPQPSPAFQPRQLSQSSSAYSKPSAPDHMRHPAHRASSSTGGSAGDWQHGVSSTASRQSDPSAIRDSRNSSVLEPDHSPYSALAIHNSSQLPHRESKIGMAVTSVSSKCPVCGLFEGDESAVSHHVARTHFA